MKTYTLCRRDGTVIAQREAASLKALVVALVAEGVSLAYAHLGGANLTGANLTGANLTGAYLAIAKIAGANLARAKLAGANLSSADLAGANLSCTNLTMAKLRKAKLTGACLHGAILDGAWLPARTVAPVEQALYEADAHLMAAAPALADACRAMLAGRADAVQLAREALQAAGLHYLDRAGVPEDTELPAQHPEQPSTRMLKFDPAALLAFRRSASIVLPGESAADAVARLRNTGEANSQE